MPEGTEDFTISGGKLFASDKDKLVMWNTSQERWEEVADFGKTDVKKFYRLAFSPNGQWLAVVSYDGEKP